MTKPTYSRGSEWREWDLHVHTPASFQWRSEKYGKDAGRNDKLTDEMIAAFNTAAPAAFAIQDYWTFNGWFALKNRLKSSGAPKLIKTVFPGIELRLAAPMERRLNAHVIFSNEAKDQYLKDFLSNLKLEILNQPLSENALIECARTANADKLQHHGFDKDIVKDDDAVALHAGCVIAEINCDSYKQAIRSVPEGLAVGFMPWSTYDGLDQIKWQEHYGYALGLFQSSPIFETRSADYWAAFVGEETPGNKKWFKNFQAALKNIPRLAVAGSDAHQFKGVAGDQDKRGYGDYPSGKKTWIKADPTWKGLLHAIKEPGKRSFLGELPPKLERIAQNKTFYIDRVKVTKDPSSKIDQNWLNKCDVPLNADLVAIIGNKGSGKSALADIVALLGNSQQGAHFSFLRRDRFRGKTGEPARSFIGSLEWMSGDPGRMNLNDDPSPDKVELVKYIPQGRFEALCNDHVSGRSNAFEKELRTVIFSHIPSDIRLGALDFDQLIEQQEGANRAKIGELRKSLHATNEEIIGIEDRLHPDVKKNLEEQLKLKQKQLEEHVAAVPSPVAEPTDALSPEQVTASSRLAEIEGQILILDEAKKQIGTASDTLAKRRRALLEIKDRVSILQTQFTEFQRAVEPHLASAGIELDAVAKIEIGLGTVEAALAEIALKQSEMGAALRQRDEETTKLAEEKISLAEQLNEPQQRYQKYIADKKQWQIALDVIQGSDHEPESKAGLEARLKQVDGLPAALRQKIDARKAIMMQIHAELCEQRDARARLFEPLQQVIQKNALIREEYKLQFQANLNASAEVISNYLFDLIKRNVGELRGDEEGYSAIRERFDKYQLKTPDGIAGFTNEITALLNDTASKSQPGVPGIRALLKKEKEPLQVYNYLFGLTFLEPKYTLLFQDTEIEQLSPGQRGALLLIFYLLVDKGRNPIVLDQPEENLDNETVVSLLVPVVNEAKKFRQIIMVTHNPNLAVVCDAEQIVHAEFDRKNKSSISYKSGSIEDGIINKVAVIILEGTKPAFTNRGDKYH